ncbi:Sorting nexin-7 [Varanus komodoensis]|nr:Sorting nexin-7 [Varanus komodoensis]
MEAGRCPPLASLPPGGGGGDVAAAAPALAEPPADRAPSALLPASPELLEFDDDEDLEVFSKDASLTEVNSFSPLMPMSPSSMINQYKFEDESESKDIFIIVDDPESHVTAIETFITYRVVTKTSRSEFDSSEYEVRRRYQDFLWLKGRLEDAHPTLITPPLPEKFIMKGVVERFNEEFIETRRKALHKFLNRIADHPTLTFNEDFKIFLTAQAWSPFSLLQGEKNSNIGRRSRPGGKDWLAMHVMTLWFNCIKMSYIKPWVHIILFWFGHKRRLVAFPSVHGETIFKLLLLLKETNQLQAIDYEYALFSELSSHKKQGPGLFSRMGQTVKAVASSMRGSSVKSRPEVFTEMSDYVDIFSQKISLLDKISHRVYKEEKDYFSEMKEFGPIHTLWSASEEDLVDTLKGMAGCIDRCCKATEKRMAALSESLFPAIHEYLLYSEILMGALKRRDHIQAELDSKLDAMYNKKAENDLLSEEIGKLEDKVECANNALKADWDRWKQSMHLDMKLAFSDMAENNIHYYEQSYFASGKSVAVFALKDQSGFWRTLAY